MPPLRTRPADRQGTACLEPRSLALQPSLLRYRSIKTGRRPRKLHLAGRQTSRRGTSAAGQRQEQPADANQGPAGRQHIRSETADLGSVNHLAVVGGTRPRPPHPSQG